jgi:hypothetical protein
MLHKTAVIDKHFTVQVSTSNLKHLDERAVVGVCAAPRWVLIFSLFQNNHHQHVNPSIPAARQLEPTTAMSHCHDEHEHHGHDHSEGAAHDHTDDLTPALQNHIYQQIDFSAINTLNESESRSGAKVVQKTWSERLNEEPELKSDADEQLLMHIP